MVLDLIFLIVLKKKIKYVYITLSAYNRVDDLQKDAYGKSTSKIRCIGPINSHDSQYFSFEDIFWDLNDDISYVCITSVSFLFFDGTKKTYEGEKNVLTHHADNPHGYYFDFNNNNTIFVNDILSMPINEELSSPSSLSGQFQIPEFPGGNSALISFINKNLHYPQEAYDNCIQGKVLAKLYIDIEGIITDIKIEKSVHKLLDNEAKRVIREMPRFNPAKNFYGDPIKSFLFIPFTFTRRGCD